MGLVFLMVVGTVTIVLPTPPVAAFGQIAQYKTGLEWPTALGFAPDGRIFYGERTTGSIRIIKNNALLPAPFIILPNTDASGERGLLGLALDPGFPSSPYVYAYQTFIDSINGTIYNRIVRILASGDMGVSFTVILRMPALSVATNHNGGVIAFGPDKMLYAVVGENANQALSQDPASPMGKVLRMYRENGTAPPDNPFVGNASWNPLVYTYGHRNMFGLAFHPVTARPYVTENGPNCNDEVNLLPNLTGSNRNFGWGVAATCATPPPAPNNTNQDGPNPVLPIQWWPSTICPTNAAIYGGPYFPAFRGDLFMGDCNFGNFHRLDLVPPNYDSVASDSIVWTAPAGNIILDVEVGLDEAIWITTTTYAANTGAIYRYWDSGRPPVASFTAAPNPAFVTETVTFDASASYDPDGRIMTYAWNFGDLTLGSNPVESHSYTAIGTYNVSLTVTDNETFTAIAYRDVVVQPAPPGPVARFVASPSPVDPNVPVTFNASTSSDPGGTIVSYAWDFGDSSPAGSGVVTTHSYGVRGTFTATLNVTDNRSLFSTATHQVVVDVSPQAAFQSVPTTVHTGVVVTFDGSTSTDPDGTIVLYSWDFGDGFFDAGVQVTHTYIAKGRFIAALTVRDDAGLLDRATSVIDVRNRAPEILASAPGIGPVTVAAGSTQTFNVTGSDLDGDGLTYTWRLDGSVVGGNTNAFNFTSANPGTYLVNVTVSDGLLSTSREWTVTVTASPSFLSSVWPITILAVVVLGAILLVLWARRKRRPAQPPPPT